MVRTLTPLSSKSNAILCMQAKLTIICVDNELKLTCAGNFWSAVCISLQAPFFPREAELKGATATEYGLVFGVYELGIIVLSPIAGMLVSLVWFGCRCEPYN